MIKYATVKPVNYRCVIYIQPTDINNNYKYTFKGSLKDILIDFFMLYSRYENNICIQNKELVRVTFNFQVYNMHVNFLLFYLFFFFGFINH